MMHASPLTQEEIIAFPSLTAETKQGLIQQAESHFDECELQVKQACALMEQTGLSDDKMELVRRMRMLGRAKTALRRIKDCEIEHGGPSQLQ